MKGNKTTIWKNISLLTYIGITMTVPILAGVYIGNYLDAKFEAGSIFMLIGILLGVASGFINVYKIIMKDINKK